MKNGGQEKESKHWQHRSMGFSSLRVFQAGATYHHLYYEGMNGTLESYLKQVNQYAEDMLFQLVKQMAKDEGVNEALKASDQLEWERIFGGDLCRKQEVLTKLTTVTGA